MKSEIRIWQAIAVVALVAAVALAIWGLPWRDRGEVPRSVSLPPLGYAVTGFDALPGWQADNHAAAVEPFLRSCVALMAREPDAPANPLEYIGPDQPVSFAGKVADWRPACEAARDLVAGERNTLDNARIFFETHFTPVAITQPDVQGEDGPAMTPRGLFTGYYEPVFPASATPTEEFSAPVLARPRDLVTVDLGQFRPELAGTRIAGRIVDGQLIPYDTHAQIVENGVEAQVLAWMNPNDLLFMQIQGSGRLDIGGEALRVGYAAPNGHPYTAIGRELIRMGEMPLEEITMSSIRDWLEQADPAEAARVRQVNQSYIFFRPISTVTEDGLGPIGSQGVQLVDGRSLAVDRRFHALGAPVYIALETDQTHPYPMNRLMVAQDTGGAIQGAVRGDVYVGSGAEAGEAAGQMRRQGRLFVLVPNTVAEGL